MTEVLDAISIKELILNKVIAAATIEEANATATVTISNVAPAGVGTATISGWLKFTNSAGTVCYIPYWT